MFPSSLQVNQTVVCHFQAQLTNRFIQDGEKGAGIFRKSTPSILFICQGSCANTAICVTNWRTPITGCCILENFILSDSHLLFRICRERFAHSGFPDWLIPCKFGDTCRSIKDRTHLKAYKHSAGRTLNTNDLEVMHAKSSHLLFPFLSLLFLFQYIISISLIFLPLYFLL